MARKGKAWKDKERQGTTWEGKAIHRKGRQGKASGARPSQDKVGKGKGRIGKKRKIKERHGKTRQGKARTGKTSQGGEYQGPKTKNKAQHSDPIASYAPKDDKIARCNNARARARAADYRLLPVYSPSNPDHVVPADVTWAHTHSTHVLRCIEWDSSGRLVVQCRCQPSYNSPPTT